MSERTVSLNRVRYLHQMPRRLLRTFLDLGAMVSGPNYHIQLTILNERG
jgi:hypothetical protein